ncbi:MAG: tetratricopeptide repeat protein [Methanobacterium sp.]|nr:tetratricopeptide repeat protein [Methanobacterium sp.]
MDLITVLGAMALAYGAMLVIYYRSRSTEKHQKTSDLMLKGIRSMRHGNLDKALIYFNKAYEYCMETDNIEETAEALYNIGLIYKEKDDIENAIKYLKSADEIYYQLRDRDGKQKVKSAIISIRS